MNVLSNAFSANGSSSSRQWHGGTGHMVASGTFGSGTLTVQYSDDSGSTWYGTKTLTASGDVEFSFPPGLVRMTLSGATGPDFKGWLFGPRASRNTEHMSAS